MSGMRVHVLISMQSIFQLCTVTNARNYTILGQRLSLCYLLSQFHDSRAGTGSALSALAASQTRSEIQDSSPFDMQEVMRDIFWESVQKCIIMETILSLCTVKTAWLMAHYRC